MLSIWDISVRIILFIFLVVALGLTGNLADTAFHSNSQVNFCVFACAFGLLTSSIYGIAACFMGFLAMPVILLAIDFVNFIFCFAGATALADALGSRECGTRWYLNGNVITQGSYSRCRISKASIVFLYVICFIFLASAIVHAVFMWRYGLWGKRKSSLNTNVEAAVGAPVDAPVAEYPTGPVMTQV